MKSVLAAILCFAIALGARATAAPADSLTDAQLTDYAAKLFRGDPSISPPQNTKSRLILGRYHGAEIQAVGVPCINCSIGGVALYYVGVEDSETCIILDGVELSYWFSELVTDIGNHGETLCVPGVLARAGLVGQGRAGEFIQSTVASADGPVFTDESLVALVRGILDINYRGHAPDLKSASYHGQRLKLVRGGLGQVWTVGYDLPQNVSCGAVEGVIRHYDAGDVAPIMYDVCIPKVLVDLKLDKGPVIRGPEFTDENLITFAKAFFEHREEYRKRPPPTVQRRVAGTYRAKWLQTSVACDVIGSVEPQCLQAEAPLIVSIDQGFPSLDHDRAACVGAGGRRIRYEVPDPYKPLLIIACVPGVLVDSGIWKQGLSASANVEVLP